MVDIIMEIGKYLSNIIIPNIEFLYLIRFQNRIIFINIYSF